MSVVAWMDSEPHAPLSGGDAATLLGARHYNEVPPDQAHPRNGISYFLAAFRLDPNGTACFRRAAVRIGRA
jgi:hypothetical protein